MKPLFSAILEMIVLVVSISLVMLCGKLCRIPTVVVKVCRHTYNSLGDFLAEIFLRILPDLPQHERGKLLGRKILSAESERRS